MKSFAYPKFQEVLEMDDKALLSSLGGSLSLWIGCSFMALIHVVVYCVRLPFAIREKRAQNELQPSSAYGAVARLVWSPHDEDRVQERIFPTAYPFQLRPRNASVQASTGTQTTKL